jgi:putative ABC transport system permease protein
VLPAGQGARAYLRLAIGDGIRSTGGGGGARRLLIGAEAALAVALLIGAGLLVRSLGALLDVSPGFDVDRVMTAQISLQSDVYTDTTRRAGFYSQLMPRLSAIGGVSAAGMITVPPLSSFDPTSNVYLDGASEFAPGGVEYRVTNADYFRAMGIPLLRGRIFGAEDVPGAPHAVVIGETMAKKYWPNEDAIGHRIRFPGMDQHGALWLTVVGVVADVRQRGLDSPPLPVAYVDYRQRPERATYATLVLRSSLDPGTLAQRVRAIVHEMDSNVPVSMSSMRVSIDQSVAPRRFTATMLTGFGAIALFLAAIGIYGVLAYAVAQRQRELSVRMALGAESGRLQRMVMGDAMRAVVPGMIAGAIGAVFLGRVMRGLVFGVTTTDPIAFAVAGATLIAVALLASYIPARRATRVDPALVMRGS